MNGPGEIRVLDDPALDGPANMARDEALMLRAGRGDSPPTLRLYRWSRPTVSLGYFQAFADYAALAPPAGDLPVVRRLTGGGAILHDLELTYSITLPAHHRLLGGGPNRLYILAQDAIVETLSALGIKAVPCDRTDDSGPSRGPFFCFDRRHGYDILVNQDKAAGSAQRRTRNAILQHGSIVLGNRFPQQHTAAATQPFDELVDSAKSRLQKSFARLIGQPVERGEWTPDELTEAEALKEKYAGNEWTKRT